MRRIERLFMKVRKEISCDTKFCKSCILIMKLVLEVLFFGVFALHRHLNIFRELKMDVEMTEPGPVVPNPEKVGQKDSGALYSRRI